ncbi:MAG: ribose 5-phosphate isomerase B [bacterium]|nr:ribose 5-phosphate isomerase B [bacterium]
MVILIGSDHGGWELKEFLKAYLESQNYQVKDLGTFGPEPVDYPEIGKRLVESMVDKKSDKGILICGTGIGMSIVANRYPGIRAALCSEPMSARLSREHNDANVLVLGGRIIGKEMAAEITKTWLTSEFSGGRHASRIAKIDPLGESGQQGDQQGQTEQTTIGEKAKNMHPSRLQVVDPQISAAIEQETERTFYNLQMIASENYASEAVLEAQGSILTNKYAEGYPGARYYGGCEYVDKVEALAIERAKQLFGAEHVNVQPHSGTQANLAVYFSVLEPGDTILGMELSHGGHLTHGSPANLSGKYFRCVSYGVDRKTETVDFETLRNLALAHRPKLIVAGASAYPRQLDWQAFRQIADECGAFLMADIAHIAGLIAAGLHPSPIPYCEFVTTTTHKTLRGPRGGMIMCKREFASKIDKAVFPGTQGGPMMHIIAAKAVCFKEALSEDFRLYQQQVVKNAKVIAEEMQGGGFRVVSGGTDNHLVLLDLSPKGITGKDAEAALDASGITINKNEIPFDTKGSRITSGIRIGSPAVTSRGMKEPEMKYIAQLMIEVLNHIGDQAVYARVKEAVRELCGRFPIYQSRLGRYGGAVNQSG